jgi:hypothetical protein
MDGYVDRWIGGWIDRGIDGWVEGYIIDLSLE